jgi:hypothetical protein
MMRDFAMPKETRKHRESLIRERLIDERLLPLKRLYGTAGRKVICAVKKWCDAADCLCSRRTRAAS